MEYECEAPDGDIDCGSEGMLIMINYYFYIQCDDSYGDQMWICLVIFKVLKNRFILKKISFLYEIKLNLSLIN